MALLVSTRGDNVHVERGSVAKFFFCSGLYTWYTEAGSVSLHAVLAMVSQKLDIAFNGIYHRGTQWLFPVNYLFKEANFG